MFLELHILGRVPDIRAALIHDGWRLAPRPHGELEARHSAVPDETAARARLDKMGLLTSSQLRIRFQTAPTVASP